MLVLAALRPQPVDLLPQARALRRELFHARLSGTRARLPVAHRSSAILGAWRLNTYRPSTTASTTIAPAASSGAAPTRSHACGADVSTTDARISVSSTASGLTMYQSRY